MLERRRFLVDRAISKIGSMVPLRIRDPDSGEVIGSARSTTSSWANWTRRLLGRRTIPSAISVREEDDESLLFTIRSGAPWFRFQAIVSDADESLVGVIQGDSLVPSGGLSIRQPEGAIFAIVHAGWKNSDYALVSPRGMILGRVTGETHQDGIGRVAAAEPFRVEIASSLENQPLAKMLILAGALAIEMIQKPRTVA